MIRSFRCRHTERLFNDERTSRFRNIEDVARRRLAWLDAATQLTDLRVPPGNRLEALKPLHNVHFTELVSLVCI